MNFQKTYILGRVAHSPEMKALPDSGTKVATFSMAVNHVYKDNAGNKREDTEWHNIVAYGRLAEILGEHLKGGQVLFVEGRNKTRSWDGDDGKKRYRTEVIINSFQFGPKAQSREDSQEINDTTPAVVGGGYTGDIANPMDYPQDSINLDDIPF